jgi:hypothetical protein
MCAGSWRSLLKKKNRKPATRRMVGTPGIYRPRVDAANQVPLDGLTPRAKLWASAIKCERSELPKIAHQLQRSLGRLRAPISLPTQTPTRRPFDPARELRRADDRRKRVAHRPNDSTEAPGAIPKCTAPVREPRATRWPLRNSCSAPARFASPARGAQPIF